MGSAFTELNTDFGELCDGVIDSVLDEFENEVGGGSVHQASSIVSRKRAELKRTMLRELGERYHSIGFETEDVFILRGYRTWRKGGGGVL